MSNHDYRTARRPSPVSLFCAVALVALCAAAAAAQQRPTNAGPKPGESKQPVAQYDIGLISRRLVALEAQVAELKKRNDELAAEVTSLKLLNSIPKAGGTAQPSGPSVQERLRKLEQAMAAHTHYMPAIGVMALNALPGMQDIAHKAGVGHVLQQWKDIKMHVSFGNGGELSRTGLAIIPGQ